MAEVIIKIKSELVGDGFEASKRGLDGLAREQDTIRDKAGPMGEAVTGALRRIGEMAVEAAAIAAQSMGRFIADSISKSSQFEKQMSGVAAVSGATGEDVQKLTDYALEMGAKTSYSAQQAAEGMEILAANGLTAKEILAGAGEATLNLAAATGGNLTDSAAVMTDAMNIFGISAENTARAIDGITGVTIASKFNLQDYALALSQGGGVAMAAGLSFEDFNTTIATISPLFASGSDAGTSLKTMLTRLVPASDKAAGVMMELGIITENGNNRFYDANGNLKNMVEIADVLAESLNGLNDAERAAALSTIFGSDAMRAATAIAAAGGAQFEDTAAAIDQVSAQKQAEVRMDNFAGSVERMNGALETLQITIGNTLQPILKSLIDNYIIPAIGAAQDFVNAFAAAPDKLEFLRDWLDKVGIKLEIVVPLVAGLGAAWASYSAITTLQAIPALAKTVLGLGAAAGAAGMLSGPVLIAAAAVGILAAWAVYNWDDLSKDFTDLGTAIGKAYKEAGGGTAGVKAGAGAFLGEAVAAYTPLIERFVDILKTLPDELDTANDALLRWGDQANESLIGWLRNLIPNTNNALTAYNRSVESWNTTLTASLAQMFKPAGDAASGWVNQLIANTKTGLANWWRDTSQFLSALPDQFAFYNGLIFGQFIAWLIALPQRTQEELDQWWQSVTTWMEKLPGKIEDAGKSFPAKFNEWVQTATDNVSAELDKFLDTIKSWFDTKGPDLEEKSKGWWRHLVAFFSQGAINLQSEADAFARSAYNAVTTALGNAFRGASSFGQGLLRQFMGGFNLGISPGSAGPAPGSVPAPVPGASGVTNSSVTHNYNYAPTYNGAPNVGGDAVLVQSMAGAN